MNKIVIKCIAFAILLINISYATETPTQWRSCPIPQAGKQDTQSPADFVTDAIYLEADNGTIKREGISTLEGRVDIHHNTQHIQADQASYDGVNDQLKANGNIILSTNNLRLKSRKIDYNIKQQTGKVHAVEYNLQQGLGSGKSTLVTLQGKNRALLENATFSTCPVEQRSWHIAASSIELDHEQAMGNAKGVTFKAGDIPIFYTPSFRFPLKDQRLSGFLSPSLRLNEQSGTQISLPYYINLAPNYDATLTPTLLTQRGTKLGTEFRYLTENNSGKWEFDYLPNDKEKESEDRSLLSIKHKTQFSSSTSLSINATDVSDDEYFDDFGDSLITSSIPALERRIDLTTIGKNWILNTSLQDFQILDSGNAPYSRLPEIKFTYAPTKRKGQLNYTLETELVQFDKDNDITGVRFDINANVSKRYGNASWYIEPAFRTQHTQYSLKDNTLSTDDSPSRTLPTVSLDTGIFLDRETSHGKRIHTLEPRLFYTYTPFEDQSDIPIFDSATNSFSTSTRLFSQNRFTGKDRIGDANQLTAALTSRLINIQTGEEEAAISIGQIFYFSDRKVTLPNTSIATNGSSELAFELAGKLNTNTRFITSTFWDPKTQSTSSTEARIHYKDIRKRVANLSYRRLDGELEQTAFSFSAPINAQWNLVSNIEYDLLEKRNLEILAGIEYSSCCWKTRFVSRRFLTSDNVSYDNAFFIEFELKGLGSLGTGATNILEEQIYGYDQ
ncbi:MAG TPA: LPS-assembly protein LptD [Thiothrix sp.]|nr:LPS-assembly protein LptD [Thiothrix sp.]